MLEEGKNNTSAMNKEKEWWAHKRRKIEDITDLLDVAGEEEEEQRQLIEGITVCSLL